MHSSETSSDENDIFDVLVGVVGVNAPPPRVPSERIGDLLSLARAHGVAGLVASRLLERGDDLPDEAASRLLAIRETHRGRAAVALLTATDVGRALADLAIPCVALKGVGMMGIVYHSLAERAFGDVDLLVPRARFAEAERALRVLGFEEAVAPRSRAYFERYHFHVPWKSPREIGVDLHWGLTRPEHGFDVDIQGLFERSVVSPASEGAFRAPCLVDAMLLQCLQHHQEGLAVLSRVVDTDRIGRALTPEEWDELPARARAAGMGPLAWAGLRASRELLDTPVPRETFARLVPKRRLEWGLASMRPGQLVRDASAAEDPSLRWLVRFWTAPDGRARRRLIRDLVAVEAGFWEDQFYLLREQVPLARRMRVRLSRLRTAARLIAWQTRRLVG